MLALRKGWRVRSLPTLALRRLGSVDIAGCRLLCAAHPPSGAFGHKEFTAQFLTDLKEELPNATDPALSASLLQRLVKSGSLKFTDMRVAPEKFFLAHRLLAASGTAGFGIRFTVQYNLFAGSILGLGGVEQQAMLNEIQSEGKLGCFLLTEKQAGVLSGLIVETTAEWDPPSQTFLLNTPSDKAAKNWISQGYTAELGVVIADLRIGAVSHGPHPFFLRMRETGGGTLLPGITVEDMGPKTIANDLDNARVRFDRVRLPKSALLNRFAEVRDDAYYQTGSERMRIEVIGQRLLTGRQAIAEAALVMARAIHIKALTYAQSKVCNGLAGEVMLAQMPQLKAVFDESDAKLSQMESFVAGVEARLNECLRTGAIPGPSLVEEIAVAKIKSIELAIERVHALRQEVGSYGLMHGSGFELEDMLLTCKFAEGDSRILAQKIARDRLKKLQLDGPVAAVAALLSSDRREAFVAISLARKLAPAGRDPKKLAAVMDASWRQVYELADLVAARRIRDGAPGTFVEGRFEERLSPASMAFDAHWKERLEEHARLGVNERETKRSYDKASAEDQSHHAAAGAGHASYAGESRVYTQATAQTVPHSKANVHSDDGERPIVRREVHSRGMHTGGARTQHTARVGNDQGGSR